MRVRVSVRDWLAFGFGDATGSGYRDESRPGIIEMNMQVRAEGGCQGSVQRIYRDE